MIENLFIMERLAQLRFLEDLRRAELDRLARQAESNVRRGSFLKKLVGGKVVSSAAGTGQVPGL